jgi:hypothetical protein
MMQMSETTLLKSIHGYKKKRDERKEGGGATSISQKT